MRIRATLAVAAAFFALASGLANAYTPRVVLDLTGSEPEVQINDRVAVRFKTANGSLTPAQRATITVERLRALVAAKFDPKSLYAKGDKWQARILAGQSLICVVTQADARAARSTPLALAASWAANMRQLLLMPAITVSDTSLTVPVGEYRRIFVGGAGTGPIYARVSDASVAAATAVSDERSVQVLGQQVGKTQVEVSVDGERVVVAVNVKKYAGKVESVCFAEVTGNPCPSSLLKYSAVQSVLRSATLEPGAKIEVLGAEGVGSALGSGMDRLAKIPVRISGDGYITNAYDVGVQIHNSLMPFDQPAQLFYSNAPERIERYQVLFVAKLEPTVPTRVLYHHQNAVGKSTHLVMEIINPSDFPATYRITAVAAGPMVDTVLVGYLASRDFLRNAQLNASVIERVPPKSRLVVVSDVLRQLDTSSGIIQIRQTDGRDSFVRVSALPPGLDNVAPGTVLAATESQFSEMSDHVYPSPAKLVDVDYIVGKQWAFIPIGKHALGSSNAQKRLDGNYGVTYDIKVKVENPTDQTKKVRVLFDPTAGLASGVFIIDGELVSMKYAKPPDEYPLAMYELKPGEVRTVRITTLPVAGSNYPANLVVRS
jgi:hypothetical protein